ncbi:MAG: phosphotransferase [Actinomycetota bacterium]
MIVDLVDRAARQWGEWFGRTAGSLRHAILAGGPAHSERAIVFLTARGERRPRAVVKLAFSPEEALFLSDEAQALGVVRPLLPPRLRESMPALLDTFQVDHISAIVVTALDGRRLLVPDLTRSGLPPAKRLIRSFVRRAFGLSRELAYATRGPANRHAAFGQIVEQFLQGTSVRVRDKATIRSFAQALDSISAEWRPSWQHGDVTVGNVLEDGGELRLLDWEHASPGREPWYDLACQPGAMAMLAKRQAGTSVRDAILLVLRDDAWPAQVLWAEMTRLWDYPLPLPWAVVLSSMRKAIERPHGEAPADTPWGVFCLGLLTDADIRQSMARFAPSW